MRRLSLLLLLCVIASAQKRPVTHEDIWLMKRVGDPVASPDGRSIVFSHRAGLRRRKAVRRPLGSARGREHAATPLDIHQSAETGAAWSPDGTRIAFVTKREGDEFPQVYVMAMNGGEAQRVTNMPGPAANPKWRPDGHALLFESEFDPIAAERKQRKSTARIYDAMPVRYWNAWLDEKKPHPFVQELREGAKAVDLLQNTKLAASPGFGGIFIATGGQTLHAVWAPDGKSIVFAANVNRNEMMTTETEAALFVAARVGWRAAPVDRSRPAIRQAEVLAGGRCLVRAAGASRYCRAVSIPSLAWSASRGPRPVHQW